VSLAFIYCCAAVLSCSPDHLFLTRRVHVYQKATDTWYEMQDLHVWTTETMPQLVRRCLLAIESFD
jgi:hypothetical protein